MGTRWRTLPKSSTGGAPTRWDGLSARIRSGKRASIAWLRWRKRVVVGVRDLRRRVAIVEAIVMGDRRSELRQFGRRLRWGQPFDRYGRGHQADSRIRLSAAARAASVMLAPASMRAISSRRSLSDSRVTDTTARPARTAFSTRQ